MEKASNLIMSQACDQIRGSVFGYYVDKKMYGDSIAVIIANRSIMLGGGAIERILQINGFDFDDKEILAANRIIQIASVYPRCCSEEYKTELDSLLNILDLNRTIA
jgi:hypothetical protein